MFCPICDNSTFFNGEEGYYHCKECTWTYHVARAIEIMANPSLSARIEVWSHKLYIIYNSDVSKAFEANNMPAIYEHCMGYDNVSLKPSDYHDLQGFINRLEKLKVFK
jgi:hypothetical protein